MVVEVRVINAVVKDAVLALLYRSLHSGVARIARILLSHSRNWSRLVAVQGVNAFFLGVFFRALFFGSFSLFLVLLFGCELLELIGEIMLGQNWS